MLKSHTIKQTLPWARLVRLGFCSSLEVSEGVTMLTAAPFIFFFFVGCPSADETHWTFTGTQHWVCLPYSKVFFCVCTLQISMVFVCAMGSVYLFLHTGCHIYIFCLCASQSSWSSQGFLLSCQEFNRSKRLTCPLCPLKYAEHGEGLLSLFCGLWRMSEPACF